MASVNGMIWENGKERRAREGEKPDHYQVRWRTPQNEWRKKNLRLRRDADRFSSSVETSKATGGYIDPLAGRVSLADWWVRYDAETPRRATTAARDRAVMSRWWLRALKTRPLGSITPSDVRRVLDAMSAKPLAPTTIRTNLGVFSGVMSRAVEEELISRTPVRGIRLPEVERRRPRFLTREQLSDLAEAVPIEYRPIVYLAGVLGMRWSEVAGLRVRAIDFLRRTVNVIETTAEVEGVLIEHAPTKTKASERPISAPLELIDMLAAHLRRSGHLSPNDLVFQSPEGGPLRVANFRTRIWKPAVEAVGPEGFTFHSLRHSSVGFMVAAGAHPLVIQRRVGHASITTTMDVYGEVLPEVDERVAKDLGVLFRDSSVGSH